MAEVETEEGDGGESLSGIIYVPRELVIDVLYM
jgi:hypothetical protein